MAVSQAAKKFDDYLGEASIPGGVPSHNSNPSKDAEFADPSGETMRALAWQGKNKVEIVECAKPKIVDPDDVILKVTGTTVCGSDMHLLHGAIVELEKGDILGHEFMGVVSEIGSNIKNVKPGDRVVASFNIGCGKCWSCKQGLSSTCVKTNSSSLQNALYGNRTCGMFGYSHFTGGFAGGQAEYTRVPYGDANLLKLPESVSDEDGLYLSDILSTSYNQVVDSGVKEGDIVGIWGCGAIGISCAKWSFLKGAKRVIMIDNVQWRLDFVKSKIPEVELLNYNEFKDVPKRIKEITAASPDAPLSEARPAGLDVALECAAGEYAKSYLHKAQIALGLETDTPEIINEQILSVIPWGTIGITGVYSAFTNGLNIGAVMETGIRLIGNGQAPVHKWWKEILNDYLIPGKIRPTELFVTHRVKLEDMPSVYAKMDSKSEDHIIKTFVETKFTSANKGPTNGPPLTHV